LLTYVVVIVRACIISGLCISVLSTVDFADVTYTVPLANIFSGIKPCMAVVLACIPLLRPLLGRSRYTPQSSAHRVRNSSSAGAKSDWAFQPLQDNSSQYNLRSVGPKNNAGASSLSGREDGL